MINYAEYEFSFGTMHGDILFKRCSDGMDMYRYENGDICPHILMHFDTDEWKEFCVVFCNRYVKGWNPNVPV